MYVAFIHIFLVAPLFIYVGLMKPQYNWIYYLILAFGVGIFLNFGRKIASQNWTQRTVWYLVHALLFGALLLYVGWRGKETPDVAFSLLLAVGLAALTYHCLRYVQRNVIAVKRG
jgi:hypothetical protein